MKTACTRHEIPVDYNQAGSSRRPDGIAPPIDQDAFLIVTSLVTVGETEKINLITGNSVSEDCVGSLQLQACTLEAAIGEYEVSIVDKKTTPVNPSNPTIIALANNTKVSHDSINQNYKNFRSTLAGAVAMASKMMSEILVVS